MPRAESGWSSVCPQPSLMSDIYNLYAYSHTELLYHDRDCKLVSEIPDDEFQMSAECKPLSLCPICEKRAIIRGGIIDDYKHIDDYMVFFKGATVSILHFLVLQNGGKFRFIDEKKNCIKIKVREDEWLLEKIDNTYHLYHNNYIKLENNERHFTDGFHKQQCRLSSDAFYTLSTICTYSYDKHIEEIAEQEKEKRLYGYDCPLWIKQLIKELKSKRNRK